MIASAHGERCGPYSGRYRFPDSRRRDCRPSRRHYAGRSRAASWWSPRKRWANRTRSMRRAASPSQSAALRTSSCIWKTRSPPAMGWWIRSRRGCWWRKVRRAWKNCCGGTRASIAMQRGELMLTREGAHSRNRILHANGDATGRGDWAFTACPRIRDAGHHALAVDAADRSAITSDGRRCGATLLDENGEIRTVHARSVLLASGGAGQVYSDTTNPAVATGDGIAAALARRRRTGRHGVLSVSSHRAEPARACLASCSPRRCAARARGW